MRLLDPTSRLRLLSRLGALSVFCLAGCSLIYSIDSTQCSQDADCELLGPSFVGTTCQGSFCVSGSGGSDGMGGGSGECTTNKECTELAFGQPSICKDNSCIGLELGAECPHVIGLGTNNKNLFKPNPIIIGAYAPLVTLVPTEDAIIANYDLALNEMNDATGGGLSGGSGGSSRPFIGVICKGSGIFDLDVSLGHLVDDLEVPAIISALYAEDLRTAFNTKGLSSDVFFLSPIDADSTLVNIDDDGLLWHMLGEGKDLAPAFVPLVKDVEAYVRRERGMDPSEPIRLSLVDADTPFLQDITDVLLDTMIFNGKDIFANDDDGNYQRLTTDSAVEVPLPDISDARDAVKSFVPDVVVSVGSAESIQLIRELDATWNPAEHPRPFYIVSPYAFGIPELTAEAMKEVHPRMLGVNFAASEETTLYREYLDNLKGEYSLSNLDGKENFYDAAWFVMYAIAAAGNPPELRGGHVADGMVRLIDLNSPIAIDVGRTEAGAGTSYFAADATGTIRLNGTMGPPDFNQGTGARKGLPSIYCVDGTQMKIQNALTYDPATGELSGTQPCVPDFWP